MTEAVIVALITAGGSLLAVILKVLTQLLKENRRDHGIVVEKLERLSEGHDKLHDDLDEIRDDISEMRADHRHLATRVDTMITSRFWRRR